MNDAPETIWTCTHVGECGYYFHDAVEAEGEYGGTAVEYRRADLPPTHAQIMADERVKALVDAVGPLLAIVDALSAESGRYVDYGEEDAFRRGEWFEHEDMQNIEQARAALDQLKEPKP
jgi:hypothetical protein